MNMLLSFFDEEFSFLIPFLVYIVIYCYGFIYNMNLAKQHYPRGRVKSDLSRI